MYTITVKNLGGEKTLANLANYSNSSSFLPIFTIFTALPMVSQLPVAHQCYEGFLACHYFLLDLHIASYVIPYGVLCTASNNFLLWL